MNRKQFFPTLLLAVISAFLGGMLGVWFLMPPSVLAQSTDQDIAVGKITARSITLLDENGNERISISPGIFFMMDSQRNTRFIVSEDDMTLLTLMPKVGEKHGVSISVSDAATIVGPQAMVWITDVYGDTVWSAP